MKIQLLINGSVVFEEAIKKGDEFSIHYGDGDVKKYSMFTEEMLIKFDEARKLYPGKKRGNDTEFNNYKNKHKPNWKECIDLLAPAILRQIEDRKRTKFSGSFVPSWPNFQTWINQRRWEEEVGSEQPVKELPNLLKFQSV